MDAGSVPYDAARAMRTLRRKDLQAVLASIQELHSSDEPDTLALRTLALGVKLVSASGASFNLLQLEPLHLLCQPYPKKRLEPLTEHSHRMFREFEKEHPFVVRYRRTGGFPPLRTTDLVTAEWFQRSRIYNEYFRRFDSRFQIEFTLPSVSGVGAVVALDRPDRDFSERDRAVLTLFWPHLTAMHHSAQMRLQYEALEQCVDPTRGAVCIDARARVQHLTASAAALLTKYFRTPGSGGLPEEINAGSNTLTGCRRTSQVSLKHSNHC